MEKWNENCPLCNSPECKIEEITGRKDWNGCGIVVTCNEGMRAEIHQTEQIRQAFKDAIIKCNYIPKVIDEKEHNHQIVPEILYEISKSKFIIVDVTFPNYGAYYEAGYAEALGKEVIICCKDTALKDVHFDIAQKSAVIWTDEEDLKNRLCRRIEATVGLNI